MPVGEEEKEVNVETLGEFIKRRRVSVLELSIGVFCRKNDLDVLDWSRLERDMREAPTAVELARLLEIEAGSSEWRLLSEIVSSHEVKTTLANGRFKRRSQFITGMPLPKHKLEALRRKYQRQKSEKAGTKDGSVE